ncbi:histone deacetylation protein Rxt3 [Colletotrichum higginsianum IMI 349063]|uniref:Histone deacetylation protein Rxt3 n=2 Tax=Colletotrichum higginsianum (strain IMI 349063) TaxID=759273 RepID=A0A1B7XUJ3_COLHI|nr:histone deacetylation protein Rxt3 [Colletotrichum higginsianum IMI 349063]OBR03435.1 histone deacetylation protein Rxt3 [Colletotrichum higginsianum IMI 349063]
MDPRQQQQQHQQQPQPQSQQQQHQQQQQQQPPPQLPFSRNAASQYSRSPFPPSSNTTANSTPNQSPFHAEHQRRSSENPYYPSGPRSYPPEPNNPGPVPPPSGHSGHSRHPSASSLPPAAPLNRNMPPPGSPPQPGNQPPPPPSSHQMTHYGLPAPRAPPLNVGHPTSFPGGRELPSLNSIQRTGSTGSSMSISSMLGGPPPSRDSQPPPSHYHPPATSAPSGPTFAPSMQASPRMHSASSEYQPFRRPQTPDHARPYDPRGSAAASPQGTYSTTPEMQRYGTPQQGYHQRGPSAQDGREPSRMSQGPPPPRPTSQPKSFQQNMPPRPAEMGRGNAPDDMYQRRDEIPRGSMEYNPERPGLKPMNFGDRYRAERERREEMEFRERERRERAYSGGDGGRNLPAHQSEYRPQDLQRAQPPPFTRPPEQRDQGPWPPRQQQQQQQQQQPQPQQQQPHHQQQQQQPFDQSRVPYDPAGLHPRHHHEHPPTSAPNYPGQGQNQSHPASASQYQQQPPPPNDRYSGPPNHPQQPPPGQPGQPQQQQQQQQSFDSPERQRVNHLHPQQVQPPPAHRRPTEDGPPPPSVAYNTPHGPPVYGSPRHRPAEEHPNINQRNLLAVQEMNRKGRVSPLPQAVQGAQPQLPGPAGEPGIKSEFGRMFSGIGSGVTGLGVGSPVTAGAQLPYTNASLARRDETDSAAHESGPDTTAPKPKGRRRKLKEEDTKGDEDSTGRLTPSGRAKRPKTHQHHHHQYVPVPSGLSTTTNGSSHHHHHHHHGADHAHAPTPAPVGVTPFKNVKGNTPIPSPTTGLTKDLPTAHHHHVPRPAPQHTHVREAPTKQAVQSPTSILPPKPKTIVSSKAVLESVAHRPRTHLGDVLYEPKLTPARQIPNVPSGRGFSSTPTPLPWHIIKDKENCTLTVKVPKVHLTPLAREEITARRALWGTDVYTDDSDIIAACIHGGWIRGEWAEDVDVALLDLDRGLSAPEKEVPATKRRKEKEKEEKARLEANSATYLDKPPKTGPVSVPADRDMHVSIVILPRLEKYSSTTRFGIQSREYGGRYNGRQSIHDGISFMITGIRWVTNGAGTQNRLRGKGRRERMRKAMGEMNAASRGLNGAALEREKQRLDKIRGEIVSGTWWKKEKGRGNGAAEKEERLPSEGDKENRIDDDEPRGAVPATNGASKSGGVSTDKGDEMDVDEKAKGVEDPKA